MRNLPKSMKQTTLLKTRFLLPSFVLFTCAAAHAQQATTSSWTGATDSNWNETTNWNPGGVPGTTSNAGILNGGTAEVSSNATSAVAQVLVNGNSVLNVAAQLNITATSGQGLYSGANGSAGTINVNNGGTLAVTGGNFGIGRGTTGNLNLAAGGTITASGIGEFHIGWDGGGTGTVTQTGGTFTKSGGGDTRIGAFGGNGIYNISGGTSNLENMRISFAGSGTGTVNQTGGDVVHSGELAVGWANTGNATYNISAGTLVSSQRIRFGIGDGARTNLINQTGGTVTVTDGRVDLGEGTGATNVYQISAGTLNVNGDGRVLVGAFGASSGRLDVSGSGLVNAGQVTLGDGGSATGVVNLNGGTIHTNRIISGGSTSTQTLNLNGGTIKAKSSEGNMIAGSKLVVNILSGGVTFDSNGFDIGVPANMGGTGSLTKIGENQLKLIGNNTYTGNTIINEGLLTLIEGGSLTFAIGADGVNNQITGDGDGSLNLFGLMNFDLANAASQGMWNIVDKDNLAGVNFGANFGVTGWDNMGSNVWTKNTGTSLFTFDGGTGLLSAALVPEPTSLTMALGGLGLLTLRRRHHL